MLGTRTWPTSQDPAVWEKVVHKLDIGLMPPPGGPRPTPQPPQAWSLSQDVARHGCRRETRAGPPAAASLNRAEYWQTQLRFARLDVDVAALLPADSASHGFDNIRRLKTSPLLSRALPPIACASRPPQSATRRGAARATHYEPRPDLSWAPFGVRPGVSAECSLRRTAVTTHATGWATVDATARRAAELAAQCARSWAPAPPRPSGPRRPRPAAVRSNARGPRSAYRARWATCRSLANRAVWRRCDV